MHILAHISSKKNEMFPIFPSLNENCQQELNPMPYPPYLYLSGLAFLVSFADPNKQLASVKSVSNSLGYRWSV